MPQKGIWGSNPQLSASLTWKGRPPGRPFSVLEETGDSNPGECGAEPTRPLTLRSDDDIAAMRPNGIPGEKSDQLLRTARLGVRGDAGKMRDVS